LCKVRITGCDALGRAGLLSDAFGWVNAQRIEVSHI
jgi:hypothetical protein